MDELSLRKGCLLLKKSIMFKQSILIVKTFDSKHQLFIGSCIKQPNSDSSNR